MIWVAWNNGEHRETGAGYGFKVVAADRDRYFERVWKTAQIELRSPGSFITAEVNVAKKSFWGDQCRELISKDVGRWLRECGYAPWPPGTPPKFEAERVADRRFRVTEVLSAHREYRLTRLVIDSSAFLPISREAYEKIEAAKACLVKALNVEEKFDLVVENYLELETSLLESTARSMVLSDHSHRGFQVQRNLLNRRLANLLSACRSYIDYSKKQIQAILPGRADAGAALESAFSKQYDGCLGYRVMEALRNFVQHRGFPIHSVTNQARWIGEGDASQLMFGLSVYLQTRNVREDGGFKIQVLEELEKLGGQVDLKFLVRQYVAGLGHVHQYLREMTRDTVEESDAVIMGAIAEFKSIYPNENSVVGLAAVSREDTEWQRPVEIFTELIDYRTALQQKNRELTKLEKRFVTGEVLS